MSLAVVDIPSTATPSAPCFTACGTVDLQNPKEEDINWALIAQSLSRIARYSGLNGDDGAYSVAQHCVLGADALAIETGDTLVAGHFLLHDAHEAFLGDIARPVQQCFGSGFRERLAKLKSRWDDVIYSTALLPPPQHFSERHLVTEMDERMLAFECKWFFPKQFNNEPHLASMTVPALRGIPKVWGAVKAELTFIARLQDYLGIKTRPL